MYGIEFSTNSDQINNVITYQVVDEKVNSSEDYSHETKVTTD